MKKLLLYPILGILLLALNANAQCDPSQQCPLIFFLTDFGGDGWSGNTMTVSQNGVAIATIGQDFTSGTSQQVTVMACSGQIISLVWNPGGTAPEDVNIGIIMGSEMIYQQTEGEGQPGMVLFEGLINCMPEPCIAPISPYIAQQPGDPSVLNWTGQTGVVYEVIYLPLGSPAPGDTGSGIFVTTTQFPLSGLAPNTFFDIYVRTVCQDEIVSEWVGPITYDSGCPTPFSASVTNQDGSEVQLSWISPGTATQWEILVQPASEPVPTPASTGILVNSNPYLMTNLADGSYDFYVRSVCGPDDLSDWSVGIEFVISEPQAPIIVSTTQYTPEQLVADLLLGNPCVDVFNISAVSGNNFGNVNGIGSFVSTSESFPISSGLILSSGSALNAQGPNSTTLSDGAGNWPGDAQLDAIILSATGQALQSHNASILEFDFVSAHEYMSFNFLFASEEYGNFQCQFSDGFAFLLTDLNTGITTNLAVVPGTNAPVSVVTIRDAAYNPGCPSVNEGFFGGYFGNQPFGTSINFNGNTALMTASSAIIPNNPYHIKLVVADRQDSAYDSAVFIQAGSFSSGPPSCTDRIQLIAFIDENANAVQDAGETIFPYGTFQVEENNSSETVNVTSPLGTYSIYDSGNGDVYDLSYTVNEEMAAYFSAGSTFYDDISVQTGTQTLYFPITILQPYVDVSVTIAPLSPPVPGANFTQKIIYRNNGLTAASGTITYVKDPAAAITSVSEVSAVSDASGFSYAFTGLQPNEQRMIAVTLSIPPIPAVNIDDVLLSSASVSAAAGDINTLNNSFELTQIVVGAYDPNDKQESHGGEILFSDFSQSDYLNYTVRFQNTGTANATTVRIEDTLDPMIDETSVRMLSASHNYVLQRVGNKLTWTFDYINLPPQLQSEMLSQGYVQFQVQLKPGFEIGDIVPNTASIFFDTNPAIVTNTANTEFVSVLGVDDFAANDLIIYPNPAGNEFHVLIQNSNQTLQKVVIYDMLGKMLQQTNTLGASEVLIDLSELSTGIYAVEIITDSNRIVKKLMKK